MNQPIRVWLVHDRQLLSDSAIAWLGREHAIDLVGESPDLTPLVTIIGQRMIDVVGLDVNTSGLDVNDAIRQIKYQDSALKVVVMGVEPCDDTLLQWIEAGASGYLFRHASDEALQYTLQAVHEGQTPCSPRLAASVFARINELASQRERRLQRAPISLTQREREVLQYLARNATNSAIAYELGIAMETVKRHVSNIFDKLEVQNRREAQQWLQRDGRHERSAHCELSRMPSFVA